MHIDWENIAIHWTKYAHRFQCGRHRLALSPDQMMSTCSATNPGKITMTVTMLEQNPDLWSQREEGKESVLDTIRKTLDTAVQDDPANGVYRVSRDIFTDPQIF